MDQPKASQPNTAMKPLHTSYHNLAIWRFVEDENRIRLEYDTRKIKIGGMALGTLCLIFGVGMPIIGDAPQALPWFSAIAGITAAGSIATSWIYSESKRKFGPVFLYEKSSDTAEFTVTKTLVKDAKKNLAFSLEIYPDIENEHYELNFIHNGVRLPFLSQIHTGGELAKVAKKLKQEGFTFHYFPAGKNWRKE